jgi:hypothetical protein
VNVFKPLINGVTASGTLSVAQKLSSDFAVAVMQSIVSPTVAQLLDNQYFYGAEHVLLTDVVEDAAASSTSFSLVISVLDVPAGADGVLIAAKVGRCRLTP